MGFIGTISDIPTAQLPRLSFPCFALVDGGLAMIHDISNGEVRAVLPSFGQLFSILTNLQMVKMVHVYCVYHVVVIHNNVS